ncbi:MAG: TatD family hydrolase [Dehalococcoidales bacterium]|nr:TatD family hydrolase [Dehalococcoidales bacterium]
MSLNIIDTHAHLDMPQFDSDREAVIKRAVAAGVSRIITNGIDLESSREAIKLAERYSSVYATVGFHPQDAGKMQPGDIDKLAGLAKNTRVVAIGEIGLDYYREKTPRNVQLPVLKQLLGLSVDLNLPVVIHARHADRDMMEILKEWVLSRNTIPENIGVVHCFSGDIVTAKRYLDLGFYLGFDAYIGYPSSRIADVIKNIQIDRLLIETDCPFLPPQSHRGKRNEPSYLPLTLGTMASIRGELPERLAQQTSENALRLFPRIN